VKFLSGKNGKRIGLFLLIIVQGLCALFFIYEVTTDFRKILLGFPVSWHFVLELVASASLLVAVMFESVYLKTLLQRNEKIEHGMRIASGALQDVIDEYFKEWALTPSEREVALFTIKGLSISEIAGVRESREGTIKAHLNGIYRKADVSGRSQLLSLLVEDLIAEPLVGQKKSS